MNYLLLNSEQKIGNLMNHQMSSNENQPCLLFCFSVWPAHRMFLQKYLTKIPNFYCVSLTNEIALTKKK